MANLDWESLDSRLEDDQKKNDAQQRRILNVSVKSNPDKYQTIRKLTQASGLPKDVVERNEQAVSQKQRATEIESIIRSSPVLSRKFKDPDFAQLAHDDVENLFKIEHSVKRLSGPEPRVMSTVKGIAKALPQGIELARQGIRLQWADFIGSERMKKDALRKYESAQTDVMLTTPEFESSTARGLYGGGTSTMRQLPGLAASVITRSPTPALAAMGQMTEAEAYGKYTSRGATKEQALAGAMGEGATEVLTELLPMKFLVGKFGKAGAGEFLSGLLAREIPSEQIATLVQDAIDTAIANPDKTWGEYFAERPGAAYETFLATLVQSGIMGGLSTASRFASDTSKADKALEEQETLDEIVNDVIESKLRERSPEELKSFLEESLGSDNNVFISTEDAQVFFQSHPEIVDKVGDELSQSIQESLQTGSDVVIPKADYLTYFTDFHEELSPVLRNDLDGMTVKEAEEFIQSGQGEFEKEAERILVEQEQQLEFDQSAENVAQNIKDQILKTGRFKEDVAEKYAQLHKAFASTIAKKLNKTPEEVYEQFGLKIKGAPIAGEKLEQAAVKQGQPVGIYQEGEEGFKELAFGTVIEPGSKETIVSVNDRWIAVKNEDIESDVLLQKQKGTFQPGQNLIGLLETADLSTFLHESGHFFLEAMNQFPELNQDMDIIFKWFETDRDSWNQMSLEEKRENHEKFARGFEAYLFEGKAPSLELQPIFQRFRDWLINIYRSLKNLNVQLTKEVRQVFDRMLATDEQISEAEVARSYTPLFETEEGLTEKQWAEYQKLDQERRSESREQLQTRSLQDMKWLSNAKAKVLRQLQRENKVRRAEIRAEVADEVSRETVYRAIKFLRRGEILDENGEVQKIDVHRLDIDQLNALFPYGQEMDIPDWRSLGHGKFGMLQKDGLDPEDVAHQFRYSSAELMIREILDAPPQKEYIDAITDQRMLEKYGDITNPVQMERAAEEAIHNDSHTRFLHTELKYLTKSGQGNVLAKAARQYAEQAINRKKIRDIKSQQYLAAQSRAGNNALKAFSKGDREAAIQHKRAQVLNNHFYRTAIKAEKDVEKWIRYVKKFTKDGTRKSLDQEYLEQIDDLLSSFDFSRKSLKQIDKKQTLSDFIKQQEEEGFQPIIDEALIESTKRKHYKNMSLEEFRGHIETIKHIEHLGRLKKKLLTAKGKREFNQRMDEARLSIELNANRKVKERGTPTDTLSKISAGFRQFAAIHRKAASIIREMDGSKDNGVMWNLFVRAVNEAGDKSVEMKSEASDQLGKLFDQIKIRSGFNNVRAPKYLVPGTDISLTDEQRLMFALNWGNEGNRQRLMDGGIPGKRKITLDEAQKVLDTLSPQELGFIQSVFDFLDSYREQIAEQEKRLTGKTPKWVEPTEITTKNGTIKGGYFPAKYDTILSTRSESLEALTNIRLGMKGAFNSATTRNSYTKERAQEVHGRPLLLSFGVINQHVNEVIHRLSYQDWVSDAGRILKALDPTIREYYGPEILKELRNTVKDVAEGDKGAANVFESAINHIRVGSTIVGMGYRFTTAAIQPTGLAQSIARVGWGPIGRGLKQFISSPVDSYNEVMKKSAFMRDRNRTLQREINEVLNKVRGKDKIGFIKQNAFWLIAKTQMTVDIPTWLGAYDKALQGIENAKDQTERDDFEAKAIQIANQVVRDSQSAGLIFDLAGIQRGGPLLKTFTNFYSYFSATYNLNVEAYRRANLKSPVGVAKFMGDMAVLNIMPTIMAVLIYEAMKGNCDDLECLGKKLAEEQISYLAGQMVGVRELSGAMVAASGGKYYGYQGPAGMRFFSEVGKAGQQLAQGEPDEALRRALLNVAGILLHLPTGQLNTTLDGLNAIENGDVDGAGTVLAPLAGPPRE